ncbi:hypothetical protein OAK47_01880 [Planctomycetaceae bacterium]|nr:hypothetical protein [Planctomycetaceae bacterium]
MSYATFDGLGRLPLERLYQPTDVRLHIHFLDAQFRHFVRFFSHGWEMIPSHVTAVMVVVLRELHQQMIEVAFPEDDKLVQTL